MKTRSTKPKSNRNTKYNRKTHRKPKKSLHKKGRVVENMAVTYLL